MKSFNRGFSLLTLASALALVTACQPENGSGAAEGVPQTEIERESYAIGRDMGMSISRAEIELDQSYFNAGFEDAFAGEQRMTDEEVRQALMQMQQKAMAKRQAQIQAQQQGNLAAAEAFLAENAGKEGVVTLDSGLQYRVITAAEGDKPAAEDLVSVNYEGRTIAGTIFDANYQRAPDGSFIKGDDGAMLRADPVSFRLNQVISGWTEAIQLMSPGARWELYIPPAMAYGDRQVGEHIEPNSLLIFDVELPFGNSGGAEEIGKHHVSNEPADPRQQRHAGHHAALSGDVLLVVFSPG